MATLEVPAFSLGLAAAPTYVATAQAAVEVLEARLEIATGVGRCTPP